MHGPSRSLPTLRLRVWRRMPVVYFATLLCGACLLPLSVAGVSAFVYGVACAASMSLLVAAAGLTVWSLPQAPTLG